MDPQAQLNAADIPTHGPDALDAPSTYLPGLSKRQVRGHAARRRAKEGVGSLAWKRKQSDLLAEVVADHLLHIDHLLTVKPRLRERGQHMRHGRTRKTRSRLSHPRSASRGDPEPGEPSSSRSNPGHGAPIRAKALARGVSSSASVVRAEVCQGGQS